MTLQTQLKPQAQQAQQGRTLDAGEATILKQRPRNRDVFSHERAEPELIIDANVRGRHVETLQRGEPGVVYHNQYSLERSQRFLDYCLRLVSTSIVDSESKPAEYEECNRKLTEAGQ